jgi:4-amino-4-deoxy-L-arabinose transferase-like glycosyltransferase
MKKLKVNLPLVLLLLALLVVVFVRIRLLTVPLERDEGEFAYGGQLMLQGIPPYQLFYNMKFPGIYAAYALCMAVFGQSPSGIHLGLLLVNVAGILLLYRLARRFLDMPGAAAAAASYALLSMSPIVLGLAAHATHFVVAAALGGLLLLLRGEESGRPALFFAGGFMLGLACLMKQPGAMFGLFGFCLLAARGALERKQWRIHGWRIVLYSVGLAAPLVLTAALLWHAGVFGRFWYWAIVYAHAHATQYPWSAGWLVLDRRRVRAGFTGLRQRGFRQEIVDGRLFSFLRRGRLTVLLFFRALFHHAAARAVPAGRPGGQRCHAMVERPHRGRSVPSNVAAGIAPF